MTTNLDETEWLTTYFNTYDHIRKISKVEEQKKLHCNYFFPSLTIPFNNTFGMSDDVSSGRHSQRHLKDTMNNMSLS